MKPNWLRTLMAVTLIALAGCSISPRPTATPAPIATNTPLPAPTPTPQPGPTSTEPATASADPFDHISQESLFAYLEELTGIQPYSGWRNSASEGEAEALDMVAQKLEGLEHVRDLGLELERQTFHVFMGTELWETRLHLTTDGHEVEVPADGLRGHRDDIDQTLRFDSDGTLNDRESNPVVVEGPVVLIGSLADISALRATDLKGKIAFVDYATIDRSILGKEQALHFASELVSIEPSGLVLVTRFSNQPGESHDSFVGDVCALNEVPVEPAPPTLYVRMEDLASAGITDWDDLAQIETARLTWDADVLSPATSGNLVARIPGADPSRAIILGAHIDSPNSPGAMDDGSGSVVLLEVARVLNAAQVQPPTDLYLVWFGSEELMLYGSSHFVATHQELLDRTLAMLQVDCLGRPLDGVHSRLDIVTWSFGRLGDSRLTWPDYLAWAADQQGVRTYPLDWLGLESDNSVFSAFDVPNANLIYQDNARMAQLGGFHYTSHVHDPYDTVELAREVGDVLEQMARVALAAALETGQENPDLRVAPPADRRALFVASHTESVHMTPMFFIDLGMALTMEGFDVDLLPYGQTVPPVDSPAELTETLENTDLVVVLPVLDYPSPEGDPDLYDESWSEEEIAALEHYVAQGGLLVLTNSSHRLKHYNQVQDRNEDWSDVNALADRFGVTFRDGAFSSTQARAKAEHPLVEGITFLALAEGNGVPFSAAKAQVLAEAGGDPAIALVDYGDAGGQVLVLADAGMLGTGYGEPANLPFWQNLARYARSR